MCIVCVIICARARMQAFCREYCSFVYASFLLCFYIDLTYCNNCFCICFFCVMCVCVCVCVWLSIFDCVYIVCVCVCARAHRFIYMKILLY